MRNIILNTWLLLILIFSTTIASLYFSNSLNDYTWFGRSGSLMTVLGILLTLKHHVLSDSRDIKSIVNEKFHYAVYAPEKGSEEYIQNEKIAHKIMRDEYFGVGFTVIGSIIWGYGDLINKLI